MLGVMHAPCKTLQESQELCCALLVGLRVKLIVQLIDQARESWWCMGFVIARLHIPCYISKRVAYALRILPTFHGQKDRARYQNRGAFHSKRPKGLCSLDAAHEQFMLLQVMGTTCSSKCKSASSQVLLKSCLRTLCVQVHLQQLLPTIAQRSSNTI